MNSLRVLFLGALSCLVVGCGGDSQKPKSTSTSTSIDENGGTVRTADGAASVVIPRGALSSATKITIKEVSVALPAEGSPLTHVYLYEPEGLAFAKPVTVSLHLDKKVPAGQADQVEMFTAPAHTTDWTSLPTSVDGTNVEATVSHFSYYGALLLLAGTDGGLPGTGGTSGGGGSDGGGGLDAEAGGGEGGSSASGGASGTGGSSGTGGATATRGLSRAYVVGGDGPGAIKIVDSASNVHGLNVTPKGTTTGLTESFKAQAVVSSRDGKKLAILGIHTTEDTSNDPSTVVEVTASVFLGDTSGIANASGVVSADSFVEAKLPDSANRSFANFQAAYPFSADVGTWSPDNRHFAFVCRDNTGRPDGGSVPLGKDDLFVVNADGTGIQRLSPDATTWISRASEELSWSADGQALGWIQERGLLGLGSRSDAHLWTEAGGEKRLLYDPTTSSALGMLPRPSGRDFVFEQHGKIYVVNADTASPRQISSNDEVATKPKWSPDGVHIAYQSIPSGTAVPNLWLVDSDGANRVQITFGGSSADKPFAFSPDGSLIAYGSDEESAGTARLYQASGAAPSVAKRIQLSPDPGATLGVNAELTPVWSPDGTLVAYSESMQDGGLMFVATAGTAKSGKNVTPADQRILLEAAALRPFEAKSRKFSPQWSPRDNELGFAVYYTTDSGVQSVSRVNADGSNPVTARTPGPDPALSVYENGIMLATFGWMHDQRLVVHQYYAGSVVVLLNDNSLPNVKGVVGRGLVSIDVN